MVSFDSQFTCHCLWPNRDQEEDEVDRHAIERLEVDRPLQPAENAEDAPAFGELAVRDGDAVADACRAQPLALQQRIEDVDVRRRLV